VTRILKCTESVFRFPLSIHLWPDAQKVAVITSWDASLGWRRFAHEVALHPPWPVKAWTRTRNPWAQVGSNHRPFACKVRPYHRGTSPAVA
jgi:hypothetical protein